MSDRKGREKRSAEVPGTFSSYVPNIAPLNKLIGRAETPLTIAPPGIGGSLAFNVSRLKRSSGNVPPVVKSSMVQDFKLVVLRDARLNPSPIATRIEI